MSQERLETLKQELSSLREEFAGMKAQWDNEKKVSRSLKQAA